MALVDCGPDLYPDPNRLIAFNAFSGNAAYQINGSGHRIGYVFSVPKSGTCTKVGVRIHTCASAVTSRAGLYTIDSSGDPTSTGYGGSAYGTFTPAASTYSEITLGTSATMTQGDLAALVVEFDSSAGDMFVSAANNVWWTSTLPYFDKYNGSSWSKSGFGSPFCGHLYYSDGGGLYPNFVAAPFTGTPASANYNSGSTPDERALKITVPFKCRVAGVWHAFNPATSADFDVVLYSGTTALKTVSVVAATAPGGVTVRHHYFASGQELAAGDTVRASIKPTTANNVTYRQYTTFAANSEQGLGVPQGTFLSTRTDAGESWTDTATTTFPLIGLIIDQRDDGVSTGGGTVIVPNSGIFSHMWSG